MFSPGGYLSFRDYVSVSAYILIYMYSTQNRNVYSDNHG